MLQSRPDNPRATRLVHVPLGRDGRLVALERGLQPALQTGPDAGGRVVDERLDAADKLGIADDEPALGCDGIMTRPIGRGRHRLCDRF